MNDRAVARAAPALSGFRVLVVDDDPDMVTYLSRLLHKEGMVVDAAGDGDAALAQVAASPPDLVLLDVMMPGKSGFDVCQAVRADESLAGVKILMLSAKGRDTDLAKGRALGADAYMTKPFSTKELAARIRELLET
jgi:DNA-binding response OmpR family regulator